MYFYFLLVQPFLLLVLVVVQGVVMTQASAPFVSPSPRANCAATTKYDFAYLPEEKL